MEFQTVVKDIKYVVTKNSDFRDGRSEILSLPWEYSEQDTTC